VAAQDEGGQRALARDDAEREQPARTVTAHVTVLVNVAGTAEVKAGLRAGRRASGCCAQSRVHGCFGLATERQHLAMLEPILAALGPRLTTVRVLDFGADKAPRFLRGTPEVASRCCR